MTRPQIYDNDRIREMGDQEYAQYLLDTAPKPATIEEVIKERVRRLARGFTYDFKDVRGEHRIATTDEDMKGWQEVSLGANALLALEQPATTFNIMTETGVTYVTALEWQKILVAATAFRQAIWRDYFSFVAMNEIPSNYADDTYWPGDQNNAID